MEIIQINTYVPRGTISYVIYNPSEDDYDEVDAEVFKDLYNNYLNDGFDFEIRIIVEDGKTKIVII